MSAASTCTFTISPPRRSRLSTRLAPRSKTHGLAEFVAQEEMGRFSGYWWSPDGKHIAYEESRPYWRGDVVRRRPFKPDQKPAEQYYPRPGKKNVAVKLGVIPVAGGETVWGGVGPEEVGISRGGEVDRGGRSG